MKIPPVTVGGTDLFKVKEALEIHLNIDGVVNRIQFGEQVAYVTFNYINFNQADSPSVKNFVENIACGVNIVHLGNVYTVTTQYLDI